ncbi:hypothetical protein AAVH_34088 [Aphelenchoides avenae]|nr:hypothetical protein AAVH_34088 [Aphelenchus avenae]
MIANDRQELERRAAEKTIILLNLYQSLLTCVNQIPHCVTLATYFLWPEFDLCYGLITHSFADGIIMLTDTVDLFFIISINKNMRRMVLDVFRAIRSDHSGSSLVTVTNMHK